MVDHSSRPEPAKAWTDPGVEEGITTGASQGKSIPFQESMNERLRLNAVISTNTHIPFIDQSFRRNTAHDTTSQGNPSLELTA